MDLEQIISQLGALDPSLGLDELVKEQCERSLYDFVKTFWPYVEPATPMVPGWMMEAICDHLEAVTYGDITRLVINVPPGCSKSLILNCFYPAWEWGPKRLPTMRYISTSYSDRLTQRDNLRFKQIITSDLYKRLWGDVFQPSKDKFGQEQVANSRTGWKIATSTGGLSTGARGNRVLCDDLNSVQESESDAIRDSTNSYFCEVLPTRLNNQDEDAIIVIQQRTADEDVSGTIFHRELPFETLIIPMLYDPSRHCSTCIGWSDPRGMIDGDPYGEPLSQTERYNNVNKLAWPERFSPKAVDDLKDILGEYAFAGQFQQYPVPRGGAIFREDYWKIWPPEDVDRIPAPGMGIQFPPFEYVVAAVDSAYTEKEENDPSAMSVWGIFRQAGKSTAAPRLIDSDGRLMRMPDEEQLKIMLIYSWEKYLPLRGLEGIKPDYLTEREWRSPSWKDQRTKDWGLVEWIDDTCKKWNVDHLMIENKASGISVSQELERQLKSNNFTLELCDPGRLDKVARAHSVINLFSNGRVYIPQIYVHEREQWEYPTWARIMLDRTMIFPKGKKKDLVDTVSLALRHLREIGLAIRSEEQERNFEDENIYRKTSGRLYDV